MAVNSPSEQEQSYPKHTMLLLPGGGKTYLGARIEEDEIPLTSVVGKRAALLALGKNRILHIDLNGIVTQRRNGQETRCGVIPMWEKPPPQRYMLRRETPFSLPLYNPETNRTRRISSRHGFTEVILYDAEHPNPPDAAEITLYSPLLLQYLRNPPYSSLTPILPKSNHPIIEFAHARR